jgi:anti-sigma regulatory factor (Ser/Thr protein kinase)
MTDRANGEEVQILLPSDPRSISQARSIVNEVAQSLPAEAAADAELLTSELVTNAIRYGGSRIKLSVSTSDGGLTVQVYDDGGGIPSPGDTAVSPGAVSGRGLQMVDRVAHAWGVSSDEQLPGKTVWFRISADTDA